MDIYATHVTVFVRFDSITKFRRVSKGSWRCPSPRDIKEYNCFITVIEMKPRYVYRLMKTKSVTVL